MAHQSPEKLEVLLTLLYLFQEAKKSQWFFLFDNATAKELWITVKQALEVYANNRKFTQMRKNAMNRDCGWARAAEQYIEVYKWAKECS